MNLKRFFFIFLFAFYIVTLGNSTSHANPFLSKKNTQPSEQIQQQQTITPASSEQEISFYQSLLIKSAQWQRMLKKETSLLARKIKNDPWGSPLWMFIALSFLYGGLHALGPGHGKSVCCAWAATRKETKTRAALMATTLSTVHVLSATITVSIAAFFMNKITQSQMMTAPLERISYGLLMGIGALLLLHGIKETFFDAHEDSCASEQKNSPRAMIWTAFATGIVPCPAAAIVLSYSLMLGVPFAGYSAMVSMAVGMSITTALFAVFAAGTRQGIDAFASDNALFSRIAGGIFHLGGPLVIIGLGWLLMSGTYLP